MLLDPVTLGVALGLFVGKQLGVFGMVLAAVRLGLAQRPAHAGWWQVYGVSLLCGVGFTMSLFIGLLAFAHAPELEAETKVGVLLGSLACMAAGALVLRFAPPGRPTADRRRIARARQARIEPVAYGAPAPRRRRIARPSAQGFTTTVLVGRLIRSHPYGRNARIGPSSRYIL